MTRYLREKKNKQIKYKELLIKNEKKKKKKSF